METSEIVKSILFVCPTALELTLTVRSEDFKDVDGRAIKVPAKRVNFKKRSFGGVERGEYLTSDQDSIDFLRKHEWYKEGPPPEFSKESGQPMGMQRWFYETEFNPDEKRVGPEKVRQFGMKPETDPVVTPPMADSPQPIKARVPKIKRK